MVIYAILHGDLLNPLTANDNYSHHRNPAACYQLAQSILKIGSALTERVGQGEVGGCTALADSAWLAVAAVYRKDLVSPGCLTLLLSCINEPRKQSFHLAGTPFPAL